jgi:hypothetical protein
MSLKLRVLLFVTVLAFFANSVEGTTSVEPVSTVTTVAGTGTTVKQEESTVTKQIDTTVTNAGTLPMVHGSTAVLVTVGVLLAVNRALH